MGIVSNSVDKSDGPFGGRSNHAHSPGGFKERFHSTPSNPTTQPYSKMGFNVEQEDQIFKQEVEAVKQWWKVSITVASIYRSLSLSLDRVLSVLLPISPSIFYHFPLYSPTFSLYSLSLLSLYPLLTFLSSLSVSLPCHTPLPSTTSSLSLSPLQSPRFAKTKRPYTAEQVVSKRGTIQQQYPSNDQGKKLWKTLEAHAAKGSTSHTYGALDPVQVTQMAKYLETVYVSGWQSSSTASSTNEPGPDLAGE